MGIQVNSTFLDQIGLASFDLGYLVVGVLVLAIFILILLIMLIVQINKSSKLKKRLDKFLLGKEGTSLEEDIARLYEDNQFLKNSTENKENPSPTSSLRKRKRKWGW